MVSNSTTNHSTKSNSTNQTGNQAGKQAGKQAWVGTCHFWRQRAADAPADLGDYLKEYQATAVILATDLDDYKTKLGHFLTHNQCGLLHVPNAELVADFMRTHGHNETILRHVEQLTPEQPVRLYDLLWLNEADQPAEQETPETHYLTIETIEGIEPLDQQMGVHPKKMIPDALQSYMFNTSESPELNSDTPQAKNQPKQQPEQQPSTPARTYAVLDAAKVPNLSDLLHSSGLTYQCLFTGQAYIELQQVAPYLVELQPDCRLVSQLFTKTDDDVPWHLWDKEPGVYINARKDFPALYQHLRKFLKIRNEAGKWYFLKFWHPAASGHYLQSFQTVPSRIMSFFALGTDEPIHNLLAITKTSAHCYTPDIKQLLADNIALATMINPIYSAKDFQRLAKQVRHIKYQTMAENLQQDFPEQVANITQPDLLGIIEQSVSRMQSYGFTKQRYLYILLAWELHYGANYEHKDPDGKLLNICQSHSAEITKFKQFCDRMGMLKAPKSTSKSVTNQQHAAEIIQHE